MTVSTECSACGAELKLKSREAIGRRLRCPQCSEMFVAMEAASEIWEDDDAGVEVEVDDRVDRPRREVRRGTAQRAAKSRGPMPIVIGSVFALVAGVGVYFGFQRPVGDRQAENQEQFDAPRTEVVGEPITDDEVGVFANRITHAVMTGDAQTVSVMLNPEAILDKCVAGVDTSDAVRNGFRQGALAELRKGALAKEIISVVSDGGDYSYLRTFRDGELSQALFRMVGKDGALNYHRFDLTRDGAGQVVSGDVYVFLSGEYISTTLRRAYVPLAAQENSGILSRLSQLDRDMVAIHQVLPQLNAARQAGDHARILQIIDGLPQAARQQKFVLILRFNAAQQVNDVEYLKTLEEIQQLFPNDPGLDLIKLDYYILKEDYSAAQDIVDRLDKAIRGDPHLELVRANIFLRSQKYPEALAKAQILVDGADERLVGAGHQVKLEVAVATNDHAATLVELITLTDEYGWEFQNLTTFPTYAEFVKSPEYAEWLKR